MVSTTEETLTMTVDDHYIDANSITYESIGFTPKGLHELDSVHIHVDGPADPGRFREWMKTMAKQDVHGRLLAVVTSILGPQSERPEFKEEGNHHSPDNTFKSYSTFLVGQRTPLNLVLDKIEESFEREGDVFNGVAVEAERVVARRPRTQNGQWRCLDPNTMSNRLVLPFERLPSGVEAISTAEIHHGFNLVPFGLSLTELEEILHKLMTKLTDPTLPENERVELFQWSVFLSGGQLNVRSNSFWKQLEGTFEIMQRENRLVRRALRDLSVEHAVLLPATQCVGSTLEDVGGVWKY